MRTRTLWLSVPCLAVQLLACTGSLDPAEAPGRTHVIVHGTVESVTGEPVASASLQAMILDSTCAGRAGEFALPAPHYAKADGSYRLHIHSAHGPQDACLWMIVRSPDLVRVVDTVSVLPLRDEHEDPDSVRIDFRLR